MKPHICPVCSGRGNVPNGFYLSLGATTSLTPETCRSCVGSGYVWEMDTIDWGSAYKWSESVEPYKTKIKES